MKKLFIIFILFSTKAICQNPADIEIKPTLGNNSYREFVPISIQSVRLKDRFKIGFIETDEDVAREYFKYCQTQFDTLRSVYASDVVKSVFLNGTFSSDTKEKNDSIRLNVIETAFRYNEEIKTKGIICVGGKGRAYVLVKKQPTELDFMKWYLKR